MQIGCVECGTKLVVPPEKARAPKTRVRCRCGAVFTLEEAMALDGGRGGGAAVVGPREAPAAQVSPGPHLDQDLAAAAPTPPPPAPVTAPRGPTPRTGPLSCVNHPALASTSLCPRCRVGYCAACENRVQNAVACGRCEGLCEPAKDYQQRQARERWRARPMWDEIPSILSYPTRDPVGFFFLALFVWIFALLGRLALFGGALGFLFSQGLLMGYAFHALTKVADGNLRDFMPDFRDLDDIAKPLRLGGAALLISTGPLLLAAFLLPGVTLLKYVVEHPGPGAGVVHAAALAQPPEEATPEAEDSGQAAGDTSEPGPLEGLPTARTLLLWGVLVVVAFVWKLAYTPMALTVAGLSRSVLKTLNPALGLETMRLMGGVYWQAWLLYLAVEVVRTVAGLVVSSVPLVGSLVRAFIDAYAWLAVGCTLGLAVFKKARELDWD